MNKMTTKEEETAENEIAAKDPFYGDAPIPEDRLERYNKGTRIKTKKIRDRKLKGTLDLTEKKYGSAVKQAARYELLLTEEPGFLETEEGEESWMIDQQSIVKEADIASANKHFQLKLEEFGPYRIDYTRNGRHLLIGGKRGHVAAFDWMTKRLTCEMNVMESVEDIKWLHTENMFAVAQRKWLYIYDNQGIEIHCMKRLNDTLRLDFLPYHFLLTTTNRHGYLQYTDISTGNIVSTINTKGGRLNVMCHNPHNAVVLLGHHNGSISMWSPNQKEPLVRMLCHKTAIRSMAVEKRGNYLATAGQDRKMKIFDLRMYKPLHSYQLSTGPSNLCFSQRNLLAATSNNVVEIYNDPCIQVQERPYLVHKMKLPAEDIAFCPYEDVLGVGAADGFVSLLVPGAGEPNYDAFEANPNRSKQQRREWEVKALLEKIQPEMISLDPFMLSKVDHVTAERLRKDREEILGYVPDKPAFAPRHKKKGRSKSGHVEKRKKKVKGEKLRNHIRDEMKTKREMLKKDERKAGRLPHTVTTDGSQVEPAIMKSALDRFKK
nr:WD repeat-containing protein 46-like isoform X2 [Ciona intestinalis]|eukprot:XP_009859601.1 WD repeat-containing protein 46-like isoform X2 [Ciona intestinalis]